MSFKGKTNAGRYEKANLTQDHINCLNLKRKLRKTFLDQIKRPFSIVEPFAGKEEMFLGLYNRYELSERLALDIAPEKPHIQQADANEYPIGKKIAYDVVDLDHHKLEVLQTFKAWCENLTGDAVVFLTFGIMSFVRKTFVKEKTVHHAGGDQLTQLEYSMCSVLPERYVLDCAEANGYKVEGLVKLRYKHIVNYYGFKLIKNDS